MKRFHENSDDSVLPTLFALFDRDGNGKISRTELRVTMNSITIEGVSEAEVDAMLEEADTDHDGGIDSDEFIVIMKRNRDG
jgi:Ca2+-binding EF-hand superfamily protein